jgi:DNA-binding CsgD family transcriptional regulator
LPILPIIGSLPLIIKSPSKPLFEGIVDESTVQPNAGKLLSGREILIFGWSAVFGLLFDIFTVGLTFWPAKAGLEGSSGFAFKPLAYLMILFAVVVMVRRLTSPSDVFLRLFYRSALPVGAAIMLASPFLEKVIHLNDIPLAASLSYLGVGLLYLIGFGTLFWLTGAYRGPAVRLLALASMACVASMGLGLLLFSLLGANAQIVSLCVLSIFLMLLVITAIRETARPLQDSLPAEHDASDAVMKQVCRQCSESYALSPRESEILVFLIRGRGSAWIGEKLCISPETVRTHSKRIYMKMDVHTKEELIDLVEKIATLP